MYGRDDFAIFQPISNLGSPAESVVGFLNIQDPPLDDSNFELTFVVTTQEFLPPKFSAEALRANPEDEPNVILSGRELPVPVAV
jgi:hypothetical protein